MGNYTFGRWRQMHGFITPGGTPLFVCDRCGGSEHLHGVEYPKRKMVCDQCGSINVYPWEKTYDEESQPKPSHTQSPELIALKRIVYQYCTVHGDNGLVFDHQFKSAGENAFNVLGIKQNDPVPDEWLL